MSKAIAGAALIGVAFAATAWVGGIGGIMALASQGGMLGLYASATIAIAASGLSMEMAAISNELTANRGQNITTRMVAGLRQIIYGMQRIGGTVVYQSTTGAGGSGGNYVYNYIIAVAAHQIDGYVNLYLDGRQVYWAQTGSTACLGCGALATQPTCAVTRTGTTVTGITATGGAGLANIKPTRYRVRIWGGGGSGAAAYAVNTGTPAAPVWTVTITNNGSGYTSTPSVEIQGAYTFGGQGAADQQDPSQPGYGLGYGIGPNGQHYDFAGKVFCEARFGDQPPGDVMGSLTSNDGNWASVGGKSPTLRGIAYIYLNVGYDAVNFPAAPEIRLTLTGKNDIYDPRTGETGYSVNWALQVADVLGNMGNGIEPPLGLGDGPITSWPTAAIDQLIAAANVCDETVSTSQGDTPQWVQSIHFDTSTSAGDQVALMLPTAAGRVIRIGGGWMIFPAYWQGPSFAFDESALIGKMQWTPKRSFKDLINCVNGTYIAPNYPYSTKVTGGIPGQLYDQNGWYYGTIDDLWPFAFQPTNFPQYAQDVLHDYAANEWLAEDGGIVLPKELALRGVLDIVQAQRAAKVVLLRNRYQGTGSFPMSLSAWQMQPTDVMGFTFAGLGWNSKVLEVDAITLSIQQQEGDGGDEGSAAMAITTMVKVNETGPDVYEWSGTEELTPYDVPSAPSQIPYTPAAPTSLTAICSAATAIQGADGNIVPRALLEWTAPMDISVVQILMQYQLVGASSWLDGGTVDVGLFEAFVGPLVAGQEYNFRVRSIRASGSYSPWIEVTAVLASITLSIVVTSGVELSLASLTAFVAGSTATIEVAPFTAAVGNVSVSCLPAGVYNITGLNLGQFYWVYYVDAQFLGGAITPIATQNQADFLNKLGYFLIGSITTPPAATVIYRPSGYIAGGSITPVNPAYAYDANPSTQAVVQARATGTYGVPADTALSSTLEYYMFPNVTLGSSATLTIAAGFNDGALGTCAGGAGVSLNGGSSYSTLVPSMSITTGVSPYSVTVPSGTVLSSVIIQCWANGSTSTIAGESVLLIADINIQ
jgi:hypothetical protein